VSESGSASANWQSVLASLGVKVAGQPERGAGTGGKDPIAEAAGEEAANEEPTTASLATLNGMEAANPQGTFAAAPFSRQRESIIGQSVSGPIKSRADAGKLIALSNVRASSSGETAAKSTLRITQSHAESEEVQHPGHTGKGKWPQERSAQIAPLLTTMPAQWIPTPVVDPISRGFETTAPVRIPTVSDMKVTNSVENDLEAMPTPTQALTHPATVTENRSAKRDAASGPNPLPAPQHSNVKPAFFSAPRVRGDGVAGRRRQS
jgi:hypothetical protein